MAVETHHGSHLHANLQVQLLADVQRRLFRGGVDDGYVLLGGQLHGLQQAYVSHPLRVLPYGAVVRCPEVFCVLEHRFVGISCIETGQRQFLADGSQLPQRLLGVI